MPHSLRAKLSGLHYKGILEDKDYKRLCHALDLEKTEQEQKSGKWLYKEITDDYRVTGQCSECKERRIIDNFCPNCGAKMKSEDGVCKDCYYNDGEVHAECVICDKAESEVEQ